MNNSLSTGKVGDGWLASDKLVVSSVDVRCLGDGTDSHSDEVKNVEPLRLGESEGSLVELLGDVCG